jgi:signal transduction histidine kinase/FixJ family two-component response regulator
MRTPLRVLLVEDSVDDADLLLRELRGGGYQPVCERVETAAAMAQALTQQGWDVVISDYRLPHFSGPAALELLQRHGFDLPFIIVSGAIGENLAVAAMKAGAHDYIMKNNLSRLAPAVTRELRDAEVRRQRRRAEQHTAALLEITKAMSGTLDLDEILTRVERRAAEVLPCDAVATFSWEPARARFRLTSHYGVPAGLLSAAENQALLPGGGCDGPRTPGGTLMVNDVRSQPWWPAHDSGLPEISALIAAPLRVRGREMGALVAFTLGGEQTFDGAQVDLCEGIAGALALAIESADLYAAQQKEARVSGALALVGQELISALDTPVLLERLCQLTAQQLECDVTHVLLWQEAEQAYAPVAGSGHSPEDWEALRLLRIPRPMLRNLLARLAREPVACLDAHAPHGPLFAAARQYGITLTGMAGLGHGREILGILTIGYRGQPADLSPLGQRILQGIAQLGSLALDNARLVEQLESASRLKSDFLATMSHELRTPLNIIMGYNDLLLEDAFGALSGEQRDTLERMGKHAHELLELITATLDISRTETGRMPIAATHVRLADLLRELDAETRELQHKPGLRFRWGNTDELPSVHTDPVKLKVVLKNLVSNAAKFTERGSVSVEARARDGGVEIAVCDTGIGISAEELPIIFEPFRQADGSSTRRYGGVGLGLYIARRLIEALGGTVGVDSAPGRGSTFRIWIPLALPRVEPAR